MLEAAASGDPAAWDRVVAQWLPPVLGWCTRLGGADVDPEDAAHEVFLVVLERLSTLRDPVAFPCWIFQVTRKVLATQRRRSSWRRGVRALLPGDHPHSEAPVGFVDQERAAVQAALDRLPREQAEAIVLVDVEEHSQSEAAALLGVPVGTLKSRLRLGRSRFRREARRSGLVQLVRDRECA